MTIYRKVQDLCECPGWNDGFTLDPEIGIFVHTKCHAPRFIYYLTAVNTQPPYTHHEIKLPGQNNRIIERGRARAS